MRATVKNDTKTLNARKQPRSLSKDNANSGQGFNNNTYGE